MNNSIWKTKSSKHETPWGKEIHWTGLPRIHGKILFINKGCRTSLKYNVNKTEVLFIQKGKLLVTYGVEKTKKEPKKYPFKQEILEPGDVLNIQSGSPYRLEALEDSKIIEIGNQSSSKVVRVLDDYDRANIEDEEVPAWARDL